VYRVANRCWESIERARVGRELRESERFLRLSQRAGRIGSFEWDIATGAVYWSPDLERMYGMEPGTFEGTFAGWRKRCAPEDVDRVSNEILQALGRQQELYDYEFRAIMADGTHRWLRGQAQFEYSPDGEPLRMLGVNLDIDEHKRLLEAERIAREELERAGALKDDFLATLSHELRTPLNAILGWAHVLLSNKVDPARAREGLEVIARNARAQAQIVEDLLDMNRILAGRLRLEVRRADMPSIINEALDSVRPAADAKGVRLSAVLDPQAGPVSGDPGRLQQVFWNLLSNGIKFNNY
jgi:PAS domain S-box-containing protein